MIILDTNVISEAMKARQSPAVPEWLDGQQAETLHMTSISLSELLFGIGCAPEGRRRSALIASLAEVLQLFEDRILPFDSEAARRHARLAVRAKAAGKGFPLADSYIAAIASAKGFAVATRDISAFQAANIQVIDPWNTVH
jgi:hypothetical protein